MEKHMLLTVEPIQNEYFNFTDSILATVAHYVNKPYSLMFIGCMGFEYSPIKKGATSLGEKLSEGVFHAPQYALEKYHGIRVSRHDANSYKSLHCLIEEMLNNKFPVCVFIDKFFCPWDYAYNKIHISHYYLIIGIDKSKKEYICMDPNSSSKKYSLPYKCLEMGVSEYFIFENKIPSSIEYSLSEIILGNISSHEYIVRIEKKYNNILKFADDLITYIDFDRELSPWNENLQDTFLFRCLKHLRKNRLKFASSLHSLGSIFNNKNIINISQQLKDLHSLWNNVSTQLFKYHFTRDESANSNIFDDLILIAESEKKLQLALADEAESCKNIHLQFNDLQNKCS